ncbi:MAG: CsbD family protein [Caldilineaceae bacterium]|nr:CsbD family protein [Caldilineaceae bacterium]
MNKKVMRGKWRQARGGMKVEWGRLTDNERRMIDGKIDQIVGMFQERYGYTQERAVGALRHYLGTHAPQPTPAPKVMQGRILIGSAVGVALLAAAGWVTFRKLFTNQQPAVFGPEEENTVEPADTRPEWEDFEAEMMEYETAVT